jgi:hypothetical protein
MRAGLVLLPFLLAACHEEPKFEDRYDNAAKEIETRAKAMDADIAAADEAAKAAGEALPPPPPPANAPRSSGE